MGQSERTHQQQQRTGTGREEWFTINHMLRGEASGSAVRSEFNQLKQGGDLLSVCKNINQVLNNGQALSPYSLSSDEEDNSNGGFNNNNTSKRRPKRTQKFPNAPPPRAEYKPTTSLATLSSPSSSQPFPILKSATSLPEAKVRAAVADVLHRNSRDVTMRSLRLQLQNALGVDFSSKQADSMLKRIVAEEKGDTPDAKQQSFLLEMQEAREKAKLKRQQKAAAAAAAVTPTPVAVARPSAFPADIKGLTMRHSLGLLTNAETLTLNEHVALVSQRIVRGFLGRRRAHRCNVERAHQLQRAKEQQLKEQLQQQQQQAQQLKQQAQQLQLAQLAQQQLATRRHRSAIEIQRVYRAWIKRRFYIELIKRRRKNRAVRDLQRVMRGKLGRKKALQFSRQQNSATLIQSAMRRRSAVINATNKRQTRAALHSSSALHIQTQVRRRLAQTKIKAMKLKQKQTKKTNAAIVLQKRARSQPCRLRLSQIKQSNRTLQCWSRKQLLKKKCQARLEAKQQKRAQELQEQQWRTAKKKAEEEASALKKEREQREQRNQLKQQSIVRMQTLGRQYILRLKYKKVRDAALTSQCMYRTWAAKKQRKKLKREQKERDRLARNRERVAVANIEKEKEKKEKKERHAVATNVAALATHPETLSVLSPSLPSIHHKQNQPPRGRLRTSGWDEEVLKKNSTNTMRHRVKKKRGSSTIVGKSGDRQVVGNKTTTASNANSSKVPSTNRTTASHGHTEQQGGGASIRFGTFGNRGHFGNRVPIRDVPVRASSVAPAAVVNLPGIRPNIDRTGAQSAPPLTSPQKTEDQGSDALRLAWNNARKKRDHKMATKGNSKESGDQPRWNSFHSMKNTYESNATSIRNRMLRGINPKKNR